MIRDQALHHTAKSNVAYLTPFPRQRTQVPSTNKSQRVLSVSMMRRRSTSVTRSMKRRSVDVMKGWKSALTLLLHSLPSTALRKGQDLCPVFRNRYQNGFRKLCTNTNNCDSNSLGTSPNVTNCINTTIDLNHQKVSIAVVGTGAVGSYYGGRLWEQKDMYDVKFHMRSAHNLDACRKNGLQIKVRCIKPSSLMSSLLFL